MHVGTTIFSVGGCVRSGVCVLPPASSASLEFAYVVVQSGDGSRGQFVTVRGPA